MKPGGQGTLNQGRGGKVDPFTTGPRARVKKRKGGREGSRGKTGVNARTVQSSEEKGKIPCSKPGEGDT